MASWTLDGMHAEVGFSVRHMMVSRVRGHFRSFEAQIDIDEEQPERSRVEATIDAASIETGVEMRDADLRSANFFDVERYPQLAFRSTRVARRGDDRFELEGDLTIRGVTRPVTLQGEFSGPIADPWGGRRIGLTLSGEIDRDAWGLNWNQALEAGGFVVGKKVSIEINAELVAAQVAAPVAAA